jgi:serine protease inhibitor
MGVDNVCYSPLSLYFGLSMLANSTDNNSLNQIKIALNIDDVAIHNKQMQQLYQSLYTQSDQTAFLIANSLWVNKNVDIFNEYKQKIADNYYGVINKMDFTKPKEAGVLISKWISENTNHLIKPQVTVYPSTIAMLVNSIYLKDLWYYDFDERLTKEDIFYLVNNQTTIASFMNMMLYSYDIWEDDSSIFVSLPLQEFGEMFFILPKEGLLFEDYQISHSLNNYFNNGLTRKTVDTLSLKIPKCNVENDLYLIDYLKSLGLTDIFGVNADLSRMTTADAYISEVRQGTTFNINEYGIEGAAYTSIRADSADDETLDIFEFHLDRPFFFMVVNNDNIPVYIGKIMSPSY